MSATRKGNILKGKKILFDGHVLDGSPQGTTSYIQGMATELAKTNSVYIACRFEDSVRRYFPEQENIYWVKLSSANKYVRLAFEFPKICRSQDFDFAYFQYIAPLVKNIKWIICINDVLFLDYPKYFPASYILTKTLLYYLSAKRADVLVTCSEYSRGRVSRWFRIPRREICVTHPAIVESKYTAKAEVASLVGKQFFLYVSRVEPRKNHAALLDALHSLPDDDVYLVFAGHITLGFEDLKAKISDMGLSHRVRLLSPSDAELCWLYANCAASIYPSWCEGFGIPILEAKLAGSLSFCAANSAMQDLRSYVDGTFDASDVKGIADVMRRVLDGRHVEVHSKDQILADFSWRQSAAALKKQLEVLGYD